METSTLIDLALVVMITAFIREQLNLAGNQIKWTALAVFLVIWGVPQLAALYPPAEPIVTNFLNALKVFLGAMGTADFVGQNIQKFKA